MASTVGKKRIIAKISNKMEFFEWLARACPDQGSPDFLCGDFFSWGSYKNYRKTFAIVRINSAKRIIESLFNKQVSG